MKPGSIPFGDGFTQVTIVAGAMVGTSRTQRQYASETIGVEFFGDEIRVVRLRTPIELTIPVDKQLMTDLGAELIKGGSYVAGSNVWDDKIRYEYDSVSSKLTIFIDSIEVKPHQASALRAAEAVSANTSNEYLLQRSLFGSLLWLVGGSGGNPGGQNPTPSPVPEGAPTPNPEGPPPGNGVPGAPTSTPGEEGANPTPSQETEPEAKERSAQIVGVRKVKDIESQQPGKKKKNGKKNGNGKKNRGKRNDKRIVNDYAVLIEDKSKQVRAAANDVFKIVWVVSSKNKRDPWKSKKIHEATFTRAGDLTEHLQRVKGPRGSAVHMRVWKMGPNGPVLPSEPVRWKLR
jgi:hypothetical protein